VCLTTKAQFNIERLINGGEMALHYEDYVLSIQYFNRVIALKPFLYLPWYNRAVAKFYLDDYVGATNDVSKAIALNPYIDKMYDLRAISFIKQNMFDKAIDDYNKAISIDQTVQGYWINRAICLVNNKKLTEALLQTDTLIHKWPNNSVAYSLKAEVYLNKKDTLTAIKWLDKSLEINPYDASSWETRAYIALNKKEWKKAETTLSKVIHFKPQTASHYLNRALARVNLNKLSGAMNDYDKALELDPNSFLGHYNRALLRLQLGDDNRAINDFNYVLKMEPNNLMAIYNRAILLEKTGDIKKAINDYSQLIKEFPNFWTGLIARARCYRRIGKNALAEMDEFKVLKARMDKSLGIQPRWSSAKVKAVRKRNEIDFSKYNNFMVEEEPTIEREYTSDYRGKVQNKDADLAYMPMFELSYLPYNNGLGTYHPFVAEVEAFNLKQSKQDLLRITCNPISLNETQSKHFFSITDSLSVRLDEVSQPDKKALLLLQRAIAYSVLQDKEAALDDLNSLIKIDSLNALAYWHLGVCQSVSNSLKTKKASDVMLNIEKSKDYFNKSLALNAQNAFIYYNRANLWAMQKNWKEALNDYNKAISLDPTLAEAYYNKGLVLFELKDIANATSSLSKAGELGLYKAYSVIKHKKSSIKNKETKKK
jgi:tetratricopeptide repeat family protein